MYIDDDEWQEQRRKSTNWKIIKNNIFLAVNQTYLNKTDNAYHHPESTWSIWHKYANACASDIGTSAWTKLFNTAFSALSAQNTGSPNYTNCPLIPVVADCTSDHGNANTNRPDHNGIDFAPVVPKLNGITTSVACARGLKGNSAGISSNNPYLNLSGTSLTNDLTKRITVKNMVFITAVDSGKVYDAGWQTAGGGFIIRIKHTAPTGTTWQSTYAHCASGNTTNTPKNSSLYFIKNGDWVKAGQPIAVLGTTGNSSGPHLHFGACNGADPITNIDSTWWSKESGNYSVKSATTVTTAALKLSKSIANEAVVNVQTNGSGTEQVTEPSSTETEEWAKYQELLETSENPISDMNKVIDGWEKSYTYDSITIARSQILNTIISLQDTTKKLLNTYDQNTDDSNVSTSDPENTAESTINATTSTA